VVLGACRRGFGTEKGVVSIFTLFGEHKEQRYQKVKRRRKEERRRKEDRYKLFKALLNFSC
jgi:hypothetical protein